MVRNILHTFWMVALVLGCLSCVREELATPAGGASGGEGWLMLDFGVNKQVSVQTKATLPEYAEGRVLNMYVVVFDKYGNKLSRILRIHRRKCLTAIKTVGLSVILSRLLMSLTLRLEEC